MKTLFRRKFEKYINPIFGQILKKKQDTQKFVVNRRLLRESLQSMIRIKGAYKG